MKIAMLLSGGVDSSLALALLKREGHDLTAYYLKIWLEDELAFLGECPWEEDLQYARAVCDHLEVPLKVISLQREYHERVVSYTLAELRSGYTPSPDIFCNQRVKFGVFFDHLDPSYEKVASGHYGRVEEQGGVYFLKTSPDLIKDQTYFLAHLNQQQLSRLLFPLGNITKKEVRSLARDFDLPTQNRKDSQGICFLGKISFSDFVHHHLGEREGEIVEWETSKVWGKHKGYWFYTIGQRKGIGLHGGPWYVVGKDLDKNILYISHQIHQQERSQNEFEVGDFNWITPPSGNHFKVKIRHGPRFYPCILQWKEDGTKAKVILTEDRDPGIASGQYGVFYDSDTCLGCGKIQQGEAI